MEKKKHASRKWIRLVLLVCFVGVFVFAGVKLGLYYFGSKQAVEEYEELVNIKENIVQQQQSEKNDVVEEPEEEESGILPEYRPIYEMNKDMVGWLKIPGTRIDYPVMQTVDNPDYYLKRSFYKRPSDWGAIYAREVCDINKPSDNVVLYGHAMNDESMFGSLYRYRQKAFWQEHQTLFFDTLMEHHEYQIWAVFKTTANQDEGFPYHRYNEFADEEDFLAFVSTVKELSFFDTGITPEYGEKLLTLSTCEYTQENGRLVVCAVRVS